MLKQIKIFPNYFISTDGKLLSESGSGGTLNKQIIEVGGPLLLQKYQ